MKATTKVSSQWMKKQCLKCISYLKKQILVLELDPSLGVMDVQQVHCLIVVSDQQCGVREVQEVLQGVFNCKRSHKAAVWIHRSQIKGKNFNAKYFEAFQRDEFTAVGILKTYLELRTATTPIPVRLTPTAIPPNPRNARLAMQIGGDAAMSQHWSVKTPPPSTERDNNLR